MHIPNIPVSKSLKDAYKQVKIVCFMLKGGKERNKDKSFKIQA